ncbi:MAG: lytic transglycosylase domain-containing protein [Proteobacteria bacterium]|nr:lytic transglycosylase domain-containing protein [Pseudomonadota bacterium]
MAPGALIAPAALAEGFIFSIGPDGRLMDPDAAETSLAAFDPDLAGETNSLFLFSPARGASSGFGLEDGAAGTGAVPPAIIASPDILDAIQSTALRYAGHASLRSAGLTVSDWALFYRANIEVESAYNPAALSPVGAIGLGQLMPATARALRVDPHDMAQNLDGSARYLLMMLAEFGDPRLALAAYNAGPEAVTRHGGIPPFPETQGHVARVTAVFERLRGDLS